MGQFKARIMFISAVLSLGFIAIIARLFIVQVLDSQRYVERSRDQTQQRRMLASRRGSILDRRGKVLAVSMENNFSVSPEMLGARPEDQGLNASVERVYPLGEIAGPVLGYIGKDGYGLGGAEFAFDNYLRGEDGWIMLQKDGRNKKYRKIGLPSKEPRNGYDLYLTIDNEIQKIAHNILKQTVLSLGAKSGQCIIMDPSSGKILAMVNEPSFNPNLPTHYPLSQRQNRCISAVYEPGSTFKIVTAATALQENIKKEDDVIFGNNGKFEIYDQVIRDHKAYGYLSFTNALAYSSNVCFAKIANEVGNERFYKYTRDFGFGSKSGIELPGEEGGIVHPVRSWSGRTRVTMAMGQEISSTLLQAVLPYAAVANGGIMVTPRIYERVVKGKNVVVDSGGYRPVRRIISEDVAGRLRAMLRKVVEDGTGKNAAIGGINVAGKTGTSQKPDSSGYSRTKNWSSFIGFVPAESPVLLCGVMIDEPAGGQTGGVAAAPAFRKIMSQIISHPELEFTEKILKMNTIPAKPEKKETQVLLPQLCGRDKSEVKQMLDSIGVSFELNGSGGRVTYQIPSAGSFLDRGSSLVLYLDSPAKSSTVPDCIGKDLRDAVNMLNIGGLKPFVVGCGFVQKQAPPGGSLTRSADVCTLFCAFGDLVTAWKE